MIPTIRHQARPVALKKAMARAASLPCTECEGMRSRVLDATPLLCGCRGPLRVDQTREDPDHPIAPAIWRIRTCPDHPEPLTLATVQFLVPDQLPLPAGARLHECLDCGHRFSSLERQVSLAEAEDRLAHLARERVMLARAGRRFSHPVGAAR